MAKPTEPQFTGEIYDNEYFSGTQASLYIGDVLVDEISSFAFNVQQTKTPIYGYASQLFDAVSKGPVIVTGTFTINFKEANYLYLVLMRYQAFTKAVDEQIRKATNNTIARSKKGQETNAELGLNALNSLRSGRVPTPFDPDSKKVIRQGIERLISGKATPGERTEFFQSLTGFASTRGLDTEFEALAEVLEDSVWSIPENADDLVRRTDDNYFDNFDLYFTYGDYNNLKANHTVERITGVHLTSRGKAVSVSGEPIQEEYQFIARNSF